MPISPLFGQAQGTFTLKPGTPGAPGGPGGPPSPTPRTGWEVRVIGAPDYSTVLCWVPQRMWNSNTFARMLNSQAGGTQGSFSLVLAMDDPWWQTTTVTPLSGGPQPAHYILDEEHVWQVWQDGVLRCEFLGETVSEQLVETGEQRLVTVTGPDTSQVLNWAIAGPPGFPGNIVYKTDALTDSFDEVNTSGQYVINTGLWNASSGSGLSINPAGSVTLNATSGGSVLGSTAWDLTSSLFSAQVAPVVSPDANNKTLNGSQLTQMYLEDTSGTGYYVLMGLSGNAFYAAYNGPDGTFTHVIDTATGYNNVQSSGTYASGYGYDYWQVSESNGTFYFWVSSDGQTWTQKWAKPAGWAPSSVGVYFAASYGGPTAEVAVVTSINSDVVTSSLGGAAYLDQPIMSIWLQTLEAAQARGTIPWVCSLMTRAADSYGNPWTDTNSVQIQNGTSLYQLLNGHAAMVNADWVMNPGFELKVGIPAAVTPNNTEVTLGYDRSAYVRFYEAGGEVAKQRQRARNQIANLVAAINTDGRTVVAENSGSVAAWGQREAWVQAGAQVTPADVEVVASAAVLANDTEILSWTMQITPNVAGRTVFRDFDVGDWIGIERPDFSAVDAVRVVGITVSLDQDGNETHELTLVSYLQWLQQQLTWIQTKMGGGFVSSAGTTAIPDNARGSTLQSPTVFSETYGSLGTGGSTGSPMVYNAATGQWVPAGSADPVSGQTVGLGVAGPGSSTVVTGYGMTVGVSGTPGPLNANYDFPGGSAAGWTGQNGTLSVLPGGSVPAGVPASYAAKLVPTATSGAALASSAQVQGVIAGGSFTLTAYAYLASQADMALNFSIAWYNSKGVLLSTTSGAAGPIVAGSWQQVSQNATPPSGAVSALLSIGPRTAVISPANPLYVADFFLYNTAFGTSSGTTAVTSTGTVVTDGTGTVRVVAGAQGDGTVTVKSFNSPPPAAPDPPLVTNVMLGVNVAWDGRLGGVSYGSGTSPLLDFRQVQVHASTTSGFTPSSATLQSTLTKPGNVTLTQLNSGTVYYIVLVAENDAGVISVPSAQVAGTPQSVAQNIPPGSIGQGQLSFTVGNTTFSNTAPASPQLHDLWYDGSNGNELKQWNGTAWVPYQFGSNAIAAGSVTAAQIAANTITAAQIASGTITAGQIASGSITANSLAVGALVNQNVYFAGGDTAGWGPYGGTLAGTTSPPSPSPFPSAAELVTDGTTSGPAIGESTKFGVTATQPYLATAWVFTAQPTVMLGINWYNSSGTQLSSSNVQTAVTASTWTQVSCLVTAPAGAVSGALYCGLPSVPPTGTVLYATEIRLYSPLNGGVIQAGTVQTAQLAAGAVTANTIAANTVVAGIVNGTTISAATFTGSVFMGNDWVENAAGEFFYAGTPGNGNLSVSIAPAAGTDNQGNQYAAGVWSYGAQGSAAGLTVSANSAILQLYPGIATHLSSPGVLQATTGNPGAANEYSQVTLTTGTEGGGSHPTLRLLSQSYDGSLVPGINVEMGGRVIAQFISGGILMSGGIGGDGTAGISGFQSIHTSGIGQFDGGVSTTAMSTFGGGINAGGGSGAGYWIGGTQVVLANATFGIGTFAPGVGVTAASIHASGVGEFDGGVTIGAGGSGGSITGNNSAGISGFNSIHVSGLAQADGGFSTSTMSTFGGGVNAGGPAGAGYWVGGTQVILANATLGIGVFAPTVGITAASIHTSGAGQFDTSVTAGSGGITSQGTITISNSSAFLDVWAISATTISCTAISGSSILTSGTGQFNGGVNTAGIGANSIHTSGLGQFDGGVSVGSTTVINSSAQINTGTFAGVGISGVTSIHCSSTGEFDGGITAGSGLPFSVGSSGGVTCTSLNTSGGGISSASIHCTGVGEFDGGVKITGGTIVGIASHVAGPLSSGNSDLYNTLKSVMNSLINAGMMTGPTV